MLDFFGMAESPTQHLFDPKTVKFLDINQLMTFTTVTAPYNNNNSITPSCY